MPYGIAIRSQRELPSWLSSDEVLPSRDLLIQFDDPPDPAAPHVSGTHAIGRPVAVLRWNDGTLARISHGSRCVFSVPDTVAPEIVDITIAGPVLGVVMYQLGDLVLHASAVGHRGAAIALMGASGEGKSTLGAVLHMAGWPLVADDLVPVPADGDPVTRAGYPLMKLSRGSAALAAVDDERLIPLDAVSGKGGFVASEGFVDGEVPLAALYVLARGPLGIEELSPGEAVAEIVRATYVSHLLESVEGRKEHFEVATRLVRRVPVRRLRRGTPDELVRLPELLEADLATAS